MPNLTVTVTEPGSVSVQDPNPLEGKVTKTVNYGTPETLYVSWNQLQRMRPQLQALETAGKISYAVETSGEDARSEEALLIGLPFIDIVDTATTPIAANASVSGSILTGVGLMGNQTIATNTVGNTTDANGYITIDALVPGSDGNNITIVLEANTSESVAVTGNDVVVQVFIGTSTYSTIEATLNGDADFAKLAVATRGGTGATQAIAEALKNLEGGEGAGALITVAGVSGEFTAYSDTSVAYDVDLTGVGTAGDTAVVALRSGNQLFWAFVVLA